MSSGRDATVPPRSQNSQTIQLAELWESLPQAARNQTIRDFSRLIEKQLTLPIKKEASDESH